MIVRRYYPRRRHGGVYCDGTTRYDLNTGKKAGRTFGRAFACICGEPMKDGDALAREPFPVVHANCAELVR